jgi:hypothetical protein
VITKARRNPLAIPKKMFARVRKISGCATGGPVLTHKLKAVRCNDHVSPNKSRAAKKQRSRVPYFEGI